MKIEEGFLDGFEGLEDPTWVLLDYGDAVLHLFLPEMRDYYALEFLWSQAPKLEVKELVSRAPIETSLLEDSD